VVNCLDGSASELKITIAASEECPVYHPALVVREWGASDAALTIDNKEIAQGPKCRVGHRHGLQDSDLIVWIEHEATAPFEMTVTRR
jgi:hypothetical protein